MPVAILVYGYRNRVIGYPCSWQDLMVKVRRFLSLGDISLDDIDEDRIIITVHPDWSDVPLELDSSALPNFRLPDRCRMTVSLDGERNKSFCFDSDDEEEGDSILNSPSRSVDIQIKTLTGKTIPMRVRLDMTVLAVKGLIQDREGIWTDQQRLYFAGNTLEDASTLSDVSVQEGSDIHLVLPMRGAKPAIYLMTRDTIQNLAVGVHLRDDWELTVLYPPMKDVESTLSKSSVTWTVDVGADSIMFDHATNIDASCLFWEAETVLPKRGTLIHNRSFTPNTPNLTPARSRLLERDDLIPYLYKCLEALCLTPAMRTDFITFWLPKFYELHQKNFDIALNFVEQAEYEKAARLTFSQDPDVVVRVFMVFGGVPRNTEEHNVWMANQGGPATPEGWRDVVGVTKKVLDVMADNTKFRAVEWGAMHAIPDM